jgi:hypothetical protein
MIAANTEFNLGDIVETRKGHPCGSNNWEIIRLGADIKIKCVGCGRIVMLPRIKFEKSVKKIIKSTVIEKKGIAE